MEIPKVSWSCSKTEALLSRLRNKDPGIPAEEWLPVMNHILLGTCPHCVELVLETLRGWTP